MPSGLGARCPGSHAQSGALLPPLWSSQSFTSRGAHVYTLQGPWAVPPAVVRVLLPRADTGPCSHRGAPREQGPGQRSSNTRVESARKQARGIDNIFTSHTHPCSAKQFSLNPPNPPVGGGGGGGGVTIPSWGRGTAQRGGFICLRSQSKPRSPAPGTASTQRSG